MSTKSFQDRGSSAAANAALPVSGGPVAVPWSAVVMLVAGMAAAWFAAGSMGLLARPLQSTLMWLALAVAIVAGWPGPAGSVLDRMILAGGVVVGLLMTAAVEPVVEIMVVALVLAALARCQDAPGRQIMILSSLAATILGLFRLACFAIPSVWLTANLVGEFLGSIAGRLTGRPLCVGATFGGVDFLVLMAVLYGGWLAGQRGQGSHSSLSLWDRVRVRVLHLMGARANVIPDLCRREEESPSCLARAIFAAAAIFAGHLAYLAVLAYSGDLAAMLPAPAAVQPSDMNRVGLWTWADAVRTMLPWNLPLLAGIIQAAIAAVMFRSVKWLPTLPAESASWQKDWSSSTRGRPAAKVATPSSDGPLRFATMLLAVGAAAVLTLAPSTANLKDKTILAYNQGHFAWAKPEYDRPDPSSPPMFGMLPALIESLGGRLVESDELSDAELSRADVLVLVHPDRPWPRDRLERIWQYVGKGGSLLLAAGPTVRDGDLQSSFAEVLSPTGLEVCYDTAVPAADFWEYCWESSADAMAVGLDTRGNGSGLTSAASLRAGWAVQPLLTGRFAYSSPGSDAAASGRSHYAAGERLGDLVLAATGRYGKGRIVVLGDAAPLSNDGITSSFQFTGRLLGCLANKLGGPRPWARHVLGLLMLVGLTVLLSWRAEVWRLGIAAVAVAAAVTWCAAANQASAPVLPDGSAHRPNNVAYIDASHLNAFSRSPESDYGLGTFSRTLMRNGYLPLLAPEVGFERIKRAGLLISIAPAREFSPAERAGVRQFVEGGGTLLSMVGAEEEAPSRTLLADFGFHVPHSPVPPGDKAREPEPLGACTGSQPNMRFYAAWPVQCVAEDPQVCVQYGQAHAPVILGRIVGQGRAVVIGDTYFAVNANMGPTTEDPSENPTFWRWLLSRVTNRQPWDPPAVARTSASAEKGARESGPRDNDTPLEPDHDEAKR